MLGGVRPRDGGSSGCISGSPSALHDSHREVGGHVPGLLVDAELNIWDACNRVAVIEHAAGRRSDFEPRPWEIVYRDVTKDHAIWSDAVGRPALLFTTKISAVARLADSVLAGSPWGWRMFHTRTKLRRRRVGGEGLVRTRLKSLSRSLAPRARRAPGKGKGIDGRAPDGTHNRSCAHPRSQPSEAAQSLPNVPTAE